MIDILIIGKAQMDETNKAKVEKYMTEFPVCQNSELTDNLTSRLTYDLIEFASYLSDKFTVRFYKSFTENKKEINEVLHNGVSYLALISPYFKTIKEYREIIQYAKQIYPGIKTIVGGGFFVSAFSKLLKKEQDIFLKYIGADIYINRYQCSCTVKSILEKQNVQSLKTDDYIIFNNESKINNDNENLLCHKIFWDKYMTELCSAAALKTTVSCPYQCAFCAVKQRTEKFACRPIELVLYDLSMLKQNAKVQIIQFIDETINLPISRYKAMLKQIINKNLQIPWYSFLRPDQIDDETAKLMKESGCVAALLGFESGNDEILTRMNKQTTTKILLKSHAILKKYGIHTVGFFIIGFPGETEKTIYDTVNFINQLDLSFYKLNLWECEIGTDIWKQNNKYQIELKNGIWQHCTMSLLQAQAYVSEMKSMIKTPDILDKLDFSYAIQLLNCGLSYNNIIQIYEQLKAE